MVTIVVPSVDPVIPVSEPSPGSLRTTPFADLLVHALDRRATGTLLLDEPGVGRHGVYFEAGAPRKARTAAAVAPLGEVLVESGAISVDAHHRALDQSLEARQLYGQVLLGLGAINQDTLSSALREQLNRQVLWLFGLPEDTSYGYLEGQNLLEHWGAAPVVRVNPVELIWRGVRDHAKDSVIESIVARLGERQIVLREDMPLDYFFFMGADRDVVEMLRGRPRTVAELLFAAPAFEATIKRALALLVLTRSLELGIRSFPPVGVEAGAVGPEFDFPPPPRAPELSEFFSPERSSRTTQRRSESEPIDVVEAEVASRARSEPVRIAEPELERRSESVKISRDDYEDEAPAWATELELPSVPVEFERALPEPSELEHAPPAPAEETELEVEAAPPSSGQSSSFEGSIEGLRRIEGHLARGELHAAESKVDEVLKHEPSNAECLALHAWLLSLKRNPEHATIASELKQALLLSQGSVKVRWYRGLAFQRLGRHPSALKEFRYILDQDPRHIDAAREVRLYERFHGPRPAGGSEPKAFGWLFGRRK